MRSWLPYTLLATTDDWYLQPQGSAPEESLAKQYKASKSAQAQNVGIQVCEQGCTLMDPTT